MPIYKGTNNLSLAKGTIPISSVYKGTTLVYSASRLPSAFQEVEYIESTGTQYIDTGFTPNQDTRIIFDYQKSSYAANRVIGCRETTTSKAYCFGGTSNTTPASNMASYNSQVATSLGALDLNRHTLDFDKNQIYLDSALLNTFTYSNFTGYGNIYIGTINTGSITSNFQGNIYSCKIYDNGTLVRDFVPCYRKSDNVIGLYDKVNKVFYTNAGTGTFNKGNDV